MLYLSELLLLFVELVKETAVLEVFSNESVFVCCDADAHVQYDVWMLQVTDYLELFHEVLAAVVRSGL